MIAYAARTGTRRNLDALRRADWRLLISPVCLRTEGFAYALDNGAWSAYTQGRPFDVRAFEIALRRCGPGADWTTIPDIVAGGRASLDLSLRWMQRVLSESPRALLAVQDGLTPDDVVPFVGERVGIFLGGSTAWKEATLLEWGALGRRLGCWVHCGRVNSARRIRRCGDAGVTSFDGSGVSRYASELPRLDHARRQLTLLREEHGDDELRCNPDGGIVSPRPGTFGAQAGDPGWCGVPGGGRQGTSRLA